MSKLETNTIDNISGSTTLTIGDSNTSTIALKSGATLTNFPANTPAFLALKSGTQSSVANTTDTKITYETEIFDTNSAFASSRFTVPSGEAGKYIIGAAIRSNTTTDFSSFQIFLHKNGSTFNNNYSLSTVVHDNTNTVGLNVVVDAAVGDYFEAFCYHNKGSNISILQSGTYFHGYKLIGA